MRNTGFTAIELIFVLAIFMGLIIMGNSILDSIARAKNNNQIADQVKSYQNSAIKYINDNYHLIQQQLNAKGNSLRYQVIPISNLSAYLPVGSLSRLSGKQIPCLYISAVANIPEYFKAYLILGNTAKPGNMVDAMAIARSIGGNAGILVPAASGFIIQGMNDIRTIFPDSLATLCGFTSGSSQEFMRYSIVVDITAHNKLFAQLKAGSDIVPVGSDPSLKRQGSGNSVTMQTNLYLDNIVREASTSSNFYCDATKLPVIDAVNSCSSYAAANRVEMYSGTASWISSTLSADHKSCTAIASAHFYSTTTTAAYYTCNGVQPPFPAVQEKCTNITFCYGSSGCILGIHQAGTDYWAAPYLVNSTQCQYDTYANYHAGQNTLGYTIGQDMGNKMCGYEYVNARYIQQTTQTSDLGFLHC